MSIPTAAEIRDLRTSVVTPILTDLCWFERDAHAGVETPGGYPAKPDPRPHLQGVACKFWTPSLQMGRMGETFTPERLTAKSDYRVMLSIDTDVTSDDRLADVRNHLNETVVSGPINIQSVVRRPTHLLVMLEAVR